MEKLMTEYARSWIGTPYIWGGDDFSGFDCSGYILEILQSVGIVHRLTDMTAHSLYERFKHNEEAVPKEGYLACYWNSKQTRIVHIEYCLNNFQTIGASGGWSETETVSDAIRHNAYVKIRPINRDRKVTFVRVV